MKNTTSTLLLLLSISIFSCQTTERDTVKEEPSPSTTTISKKEDNVPYNSTVQEQKIPLPQTYINDTYGFQLNIPLLWEIVSQESLNELYKAAQPSPGDDKAKSSYLGVEFLFMGFKYPLDSAVSFNPNITVTAEETNALIDEKAYLNKVLKEAKKMAEQPELVEVTIAPTSRHINGIDFTFAELSLAGAHGELIQSIYIGALNGHKIALMITHLKSKQIDVHQLIEKI